MKSSLLTLLLLICSVAIAQAQTSDDAIEVRKNQFRKNGRNLKPKELLNLMSTNPEALKEMTIAKKNADVANVFGFIGGFMIGWPLGSAVAGGKPNWALAGAGVGVVLIAVPFSLKYTRHAKAAVAIYNRDAKQPAARVNVRIGISPTGGSLKITF